MTCNGTPPRSRPFSSRVCPSGRIQSFEPRTETRMLGASGRVLPNRSAILSANARASASSHASGSLTKEITELLDLGPSDPLLADQFTGGGHARQLVERHAETGEDDIPLGADFSRVG